MTRWMSHVAVLLAVTSTLALLGCGESSEPTEEGKNLPNAVPVEAPAPALSDSNAPKFDGKPRSGDDIVSQIELPRPELPKFATSEEPDEPFNPADAVHRGPWINNYEAAKKQAKAEGKDILMDFTGSDWCGWCIKLNKEVFSRDEFIKYAPNKFVLLELDFPKGKKLPSEIEKQNQALNTALAVQGFPAIVLTDAEGRPYAVTGYQKGGSAAYVAHLEELRRIKAARDAKLAAAQKVTGSERAQILSDALSLLTGEDLQLSPDALLPAYSAIAEEIVALDANDKAGLKTRWSAQLRHAQFSTRISKLNEFASQNIEDADAMLGEIGRVEAEFQDYEPGLKNLRDFRLKILLRSKRFPEFHQLVDGILKNKSLPVDERMEFTRLKLSVLAQNSDFAGAEKLLLEASVALPEEKEFSAQMHLFRAQLAAMQKKVPAVKAAIKQARLIGGEELTRAIDQLERDLLDDLNEEPPTVSPKGS